MVPTRRIQILTLSLLGIIFFWVANLFYPDGQRKRMPLLLAPCNLAPHETKTMFVTALVDLGADYDVKSVDERMKHFNKLAASGIPLIVFVSPTFSHLLEKVAEQHPNIKRVITLDWTTFDTYKIINSFQNLKLPGVRGEKKDTFQYMALQLSKPEFLYMALNHTLSSHLAWIDFNVAHVFKTENAILKLQAIGQMSLKVPLMAFAGIWPKITNLDVKGLLEKVHWRFAGGFFILDRDSVITFHALSRDALRIFLAQTGFLVWEVNFWAWLESTFSFSFRPLVYISDHDDRLVSLPKDLYT